MYNVRKKAPNHISHLPGRGDERWSKAARIKTDGTKKKKGPNESEPAKPKTQPITMANPRVRGGTKVSA
jgi:hypothetical protein